MNDVRRSFEMNLVSLMSPSQGVIVKTERAPDGATIERVDFRAMRAQEVANIDRYARTIGGFIGEPLLAAKPAETPYPLFLVAKASLTTLGTALSLIPLAGIAVDATCAAYYGAREVMGR